MRLDPREILSFPREHRGRPLLFGINVDQQVRAYVKAMGDAGEKVHSEIIVACAIGMT